MRKLIFNSPTPQTHTAQFPLAREQQVVWIKSQKGKHFLGAKGRQRFRAPQPHNYPNVRWRHVNKLNFPLINVRPLQGPRKKNNKFSFDELSIRFIKEERRNLLAFHDTNNFVSLCLLLCVMLRGWHENLKGKDDSLENLQVFYKVRVNLMFCLIQYSRDISAFKFS